MFQQAESFGGTHKSTFVNEVSSHMMSDDEAWCIDAHRAAGEACELYEVSAVWVPWLADCVLGIIAVESRYGRSPRYIAKRILGRIISRSGHFSALAPRAKGIAQIDAGRAEYLNADGCLGVELDPCSRDDALTLTAMGLAKAASLHFPRSSCSPHDDQLAIVSITHNAGWMVPRVARLQATLAKLDPLASRLANNGVAGPATLAALDRVADRMACPTLSAVMRASGAGVPPVWGLTHPDLFPIFSCSDLFGVLSAAAIAVGENLDEPLFPRYRFRRWYTGWISSEGYAGEVLAHSKDWRSRSTTSRVGSSSVKVR